MGGRVGGWVGERGRKGGGGRGAGAGGGGQRGGEGDSSPSAALFSAPPPPPPPPSSAHGLCVCVCVWGGTALAPARRPVPPRIAARTRDSGATDPGRDPGRQRRRFGGPCSVEGGRAGGWAAGAGAVGRAEGGGGGGGKVVVVGGGGGAGVGLTCRG